MRIGAKAAAVYREKIEECIATGAFTWGELKAAIETTEYIPKNWLLVRSVLGEYIRSYEIVRDTDLSRERYVISSYRG